MEPIRFYHQTNFHKQTKNVRGQPTEERRMYHNAFKDLINKTHQIDSNQH